MDVPGQAEFLIKSLKGVQHAQVIADDAGSIVRIEVVAPLSEQKDVQRNITSALMAVLGVRLAPGMLQFRTQLQETGVQNSAPVVSKPAAPARRQAPVRPIEEEGAQVLELMSAGRRADLNEAARTAFDTLRNAQSIFHGFVFDGAEMVTINDGQFIVVAVRRASSGARYCGAAPVVTSVATASARALMNAVGVAAMGGPMELTAEEIAQLEQKHA